MRIKNLNPLKVFYYLLVTTIAVLGIFVYKSIISYVLTALIFAYLLSPLVEFLVKRRVPRTLSVVIVYLSLIMLLLVAAIFILPPLITQIEEFAKVASEFIANYNEETISSSKYVKYFFEKIELIQARLPFINFDEYQAKLVTRVGNWFSAMPGRLIGFFKNILTFASFIVTIPIIGFFLLKDSSLFTKQFYEMIPNRYFELVCILVKKLDEIIGTYLRALMIEIMIVGIMASIALTVIGVPYSLLIGIIAGFANAIPYFGPIIALLAAVLSIILSGKPLVMILYAVIGMQIVQSIDNNVVYPIVMGKNTEMHPLIILLTVIAGGYTMGIFGMFLSVPIVFLVKSMISVLYKNLKQFELI